MDNLRDNLSRLTRRVWFELRKDKRKTAMAVVLACVVVGLGLKLTVSGPEASQAASTPVTVVPDDTIMQRAADIAGPETDAAGKAEYIRNIDRNIDRDIFQPKLSAFGIQASAGPAETSAEVTEQREAGQDRRRRIEGEAQALRLESTVVSATPTVILNGKVLTVGDAINGFRVEEIKPHACLLEKEGVRIRLRMKR